MLYFGDGVVAYLLDRHVASLKIVVEKDVENQIRSHSLWDRLRDEILPAGSIELCLRRPNLNLTAWTGNPAL